MCAKCCHTPCSFSSERVLFGIFPSSYFSELMLSTFHDLSLRRRQKYREGYPCYQTMTRSISADFTFRRSVQFGSYRLLSQQNKDDVIYGCGDDEVFKVNETSKFLLFYFLLKSCLLSLVFLVILHLSRINSSADICYDSKASRDWKWQEFNNCSIKKTSAGLFNKQKSHS